MVATTGMGRSTARRMLTGLLERRPPGDLDKPFATESALAELASMSATTIDRHLAAAHERGRLRGISTTRAAGVAQRDRRA